MLQVYVTDEDSGVEDRLGMIYDVLGSMLLSPAEFESSSNNDDDETEGDGIEPAKKKQRKSVLSKKKWQKLNMKNELPQWTPDNDKN